MKVHRDVDGNGKFRFAINDGPMALLIMALPLLIKRMRIYIFADIYFIQEFHSYAQRILPQASKPGRDANTDTLLQPLV